MHTHLLRVDCRDQPGLVYQITGVLFRHNCNIISNHEFVEPATNQFFMRTEFAGPPDGQAIVRELQTLLPAATVQLAAPGRRKIVVLATKEHHVLGELLLRNAFNELGATIQAVIANHTVLDKFVQSFDVPFHAISHEGTSREAHEEAVLKLLARYQPEYIVLAKYMRILSPSFIAPYPQRIINIHHSFLPAFIGASPYRQAFERGVKIIGATAHVVTAELDEGPIIAQAVIDVDHTYSAAAMAQAGRDVEKLVLAKALKLVFEERVFLSGRKTVIFE